MERVQPGDVHRVLVLGSGPIIIGQACEFDYSGSQALRSLREEGVQVILLNDNPATIMTDSSMADVIYMEPMTVATIEKILRTHEVDAVLPTLGGQTALNLAREAWEQGLWQKFNVRLLGASMNAIEACENREAFRQLMLHLNIPVAPGRLVSSIEEGLRFADRIGYPVVIRPSYTLGGSGAGIARTPEELRTRLTRALNLSPVHTALVERALFGWKEFELEVMRDYDGNFCVICTIENMDPMGIHTGDSITIAPAMTLPDTLYQRMREMARRILLGLGTFAGGCNVQFAIHPDTEEIVAIEVNPRVSRSSALASKATGYPIARIATKLALGYRLWELPNPVVGDTSALFEPVQDYVIVKIPRWNMDKFPGADDTLGMQMKSVGEVMAIGTTFREALQKACRSLEVGRNGLEPFRKDQIAQPILQTIREHLARPTPERIWWLATAFYYDLPVEEVHRRTGIDPWFLHEIHEIMQIRRALENVQTQKAHLSDTLLQQAIDSGFSMTQLVQLTGLPPQTLQARIANLTRTPHFRAIDTCAAEFAARSPYFYSGVSSTHEVNLLQTSGKRSIQGKAVIIGAGPNRIGQGIEFDYCCVHGILALQEMGYEAIMINCNPETVSTDADIADRLYFEPLHPDEVLRILTFEQPDQVIVQLGGQTPIHLARPIVDAGFTLAGTPLEAIDRAEDREQFSQLLQELRIPYAPYGIARTPEEALRVAQTIGFPLLVRPSYVLGGARMRLIYQEDQLAQWLEEVFIAFPNNTVLLDRYLSGGIELDIDAISDGTDVYILGILEHLDPPGIHSGDSVAVVPPIHLSQEILDTVKEYTLRIARALPAIGFLNIQMVVKDGTVYVLEANPRASRTVPFLAKAIGMPFVRYGVEVMMGKRSVREIPAPPPVQRYALKIPVFPWDKFPDFPPEVGPEMRSTGERIYFFTSLDDPEFRKYWRQAQSHRQRLESPDTSIPTSPTTQNLSVTYA